MVGREILRLLLDHPSYERIHSLVRRAKEPPNAGKLVEHVVDFDALPDLPRTDDVYIALGTTMKVAGSEAAFRRVDCDYVVAIARAALASGASRLGVVSALGADPESRIFYNRVKGEMQQRVLSLGYKNVVIAQPALLLGDRDALGQPKRTGEALAQRVLRPLSAAIPPRYRPISARDVAAALVTRILADEGGSVIIPSREMLGASQ